MLHDADIRFMTTHENIERYAEFVHEIGSIQNRPEFLARPLLPRDSRRAGVVAADLVESAHNDTAQMAPTVETLR